MRGLHIAALIIDVVAAAMRLHAVRASPKYPAALDPVRRVS